MIPAQLVRKNTEVEKLIAVRYSKTAVEKIRVRLAGVLHGSMRDARRR